MELSTSQDRTFTAIHDIKVYVPVRQNGSMRENALSIDSPIVFNKIMAAKVDNLQFYDSAVQFDRYQAKHDWFASYSVVVEQFKRRLKDCEFHEAIIPKGSEFVTNGDLSNVWSNRLYITKKVITFKTCFDSDLLRSILDGAPFFRGIKLGDVMFSDGRIVPSTRLFTSNNVNEGAFPIAIASSFVGGNFVFIGLRQYEVILTEEKFKHIHNDDITVVGINQYKTDVHRQDDYDGVKNTVALNKAVKDKRIKNWFHKEILETINQHNTDGTKPGEWYLGASGEYADIIYNGIYLRAFKYLYNFESLLFDDNGKDNIFLTSTICDNEGDAELLLVMDGLFKVHPFQKFDLKYIISPLIRI